jgi:predicted negative regulator of RcsB-dependent stress response
MWQRLAVRYPVWFEPAPLAFFRQSSQSEGSRLKVAGEQIAHTLAVIEIARSYLPAAKVETLSRRAGEQYAFYAIQLARRQLEAGNLAGAVANLEQAMRCSRSDEAMNELFSWLSAAQPPKG